MSLGIFLRSSRKSKCLTLEQLAALVGSSKSYIWGVENGTDKNPSLQHCAKLAQVLGVSIDSMAEAQALEDSPFPWAKIQPGDWPEDFAHENGNYECVCSGCAATFTGHKRRTFCKICTANAAQKKEGV